MNLRKLKSEVSMQKTYCEQINFKEYSTRMQSKKFRISFQIQKEWCQKVFQNYRKFAWKYDRLCC